MMSFQECGMSVSVLTYSHFSTFCIDVIFDLNITPSSSLPHDNFSSFSNLGF
ncbi:hypothetical protein HanXRQr2_Chr06g0242181 [Helianthus annuus]|uniref:Uncharacterized protein n=1 Tax=Helianthus annuus TaxID=4232 RepID=A0A9K3IQX8_HELAN|nr:hypothetical protein HanXRQr2_Chr06g0242181 [Helianthus annuus]KAJ0914011.1 hypothetical protein HanPSC8_Chr06g0233801 [Helianthus annuus]